MADEQMPTTEQHLELARRAYVNRDYEPVAANASMAAVGLLQEFLTLARDGLAYDWSAVLLPGGGTLTCACGATLFTEYPTIGELPWIICSSEHCDAVWTLGESPDTYVQPVLLRGGDAAQTFVQWQQNDLVRYRSELQLGPDSAVRVEVVYLAQRPQDESGGRFWHGMVMRTNGAAGVIVGQAGLLDSHDPAYQVARFPD